MHQWISKPEAAVALDLGLAQSCSQQRFDRHCSNASAPSGFQPASNWEHCVLSVTWYSAACSNANGLQRFAQATKFIASNSVYM